jgi:hypothetical protein
MTAATGRYQAYSPEYDVRIQEHHVHLALSPNSLKGPTMDCVLPRRPSRLAS